MSYDDCDGEDYDYGEVVDRVCYHPGLDRDQDMFHDDLPDADDVILFSWDQRPRLGKVTEL